MSDAILVINAGSSSIKLALYSVDAAKLAMQLKGKVANIGLSPRVTVTNGQGTPLKVDKEFRLKQSTSHEDIIQSLLTWLHHQDNHFNVIGVGHRVVHGGVSFTGATQIDAKVAKQLQSLIPLAPLHQGHNLAAVEAVNKWAPELAQVACFDTSFHRTQDELSTLFALPRKLTEQGIIRYGFHGLSYEYIASQLPHVLTDNYDGRIVVAHLGNGASMCALSKRKSVATSMGFTALDGLMMGQRCGSLDAGVILYLMQHQQMSAHAIEHMLYQESGLLGVSGITSDMQALLDSSDANAKQAVALFCYRAARELTSLACANNGLDAIVFTGGMGENSAVVRNKICEHLTWLNVALDTQANRDNASVIHSDKSAVEVLVIPTNEELVIARSTQSVLSP
jgi:acetate kinase